MKTAYVIILLSLVSLKNVYSQQYPNSIFNLYNPFLFNPSRATYNLDSTFNININYKKQWTGIQGSFEHQYITANLPLIKKNIGIGLTITNEQQHIFRRTRVNFAYAYQFYLDKQKDNLLSFGLAIGILNQGLDLTKATIHHLNDPQLMMAFQNANSFSFNAGFFYTWKHLLQLDFAIQYDSEIKFKATQFKTIPHFIVGLRYKFFISKNKRYTYLEPVLNWKFASNYPTQMNLALLIQQKIKGTSVKIWGGVGFKMDWMDIGEMPYTASLYLILGLNITKQISIAGTYENPMQQHNVFGNTFEIQLKFAIDRHLNKLEQKINKHRGLLEIQKELTTDLSISMDSVEIKLNAINSIVFIATQKINKNSVEIQNTQTSINHIKELEKEIQKLTEDYNSIKKEIQKLKNNDVQFSEKVNFNNDINNLLDKIRNLETKINNLSRKSD